LLRREIGHAIIVSVVLAVLSASLLGLAFNPAHAGGGGSPSSLVIRDSTFGCGTYDACVDAWKNGPNTSPYAVGAGVPAIEQSAASRSVRLSIVDSAGSPTKASDVWVFQQNPAGNWWIYAYFEDVNEDTCTFLAPPGSFVVYGYSATAAGYSYLEVNQDTTEARLTVRSEKEMVRHRVTVRVVDESGRAVAGVAVQIPDLPCEAIRVATPRAITDQAGAIAFELVDVPFIFRAQMGSEGLRYRGFAAVVVDADRLVEIKLRPVDTAFFSKVPMPQIIDQGGLGSCVGHAGATMAMWWECGKVCYDGHGNSDTKTCSCVKAGDGSCACIPTYLSRQYLYDRSRFHNGWDCRIAGYCNSASGGACPCKSLSHPAGTFRTTDCHQGGHACHDYCSGSSTPEGCEILANEGVCTETCQPYGNNAGCTSGGSAGACSSLGSCYSCGRIYRKRSDDPNGYTTLDGVTQIKDGIRTKGVVWTRFNVCSGCSQPSGVFCSCTTTCNCGGVGGGHSIVLYGYDDANSRFLLQNSWGTGWGTNGRGYIGYGMWSASPSKGVRYGYHFSGPSQLGTWASQLGSTSHNPALAASDGYLYNAVRGTNNRIYWRRRTMIETWSTWAAVPTGSTDAAPAIAFFNNKLYAAVKGYGTNAIYLNSMDHGTLAWGSWVLQPGATPSGPSLASSSTYLYMAVRGTSNRIYWRRMTTAGSWSAWTAVPTGYTDTTPSIAFFNNRLYAAVKGNGNTAIYLNSMDSGTLAWGSWVLQPGGTYVGPALTASSTHLYNLVRGTAGNYHIYWRRMAAGGAWSSWTVTPTGTTDATPGVAYFTNQLYLVVKGTGSYGIYLNMLDPNR